MRKALLLALAGFVIGVFPLTNVAEPIPGSTGVTVFYVHQTLIPVRPAFTRAKSWEQMTDVERADIWPFLSPAMQRQYWYCMTHQERHAMSVNLHPLDRELIRSRFLINMHPDRVRTVPAMSFIARVGPTQPFADSILNETERLELHRQLRDFSLQYLRNIP